jgi:hypothetical protein
MGNVALAQRMTKMYGADLTTGRNRRISGGVLHHFDDKVCVGCPGGITYNYFKSLTVEELNEKEHFSFEGYVRK